MYDYQKQKPKLFDDEGQRAFLKIRDHVHDMLKHAGAFQMEKAMIAGGDSWTQLACVDRLVELGEIRELNIGEVAGQHRVFVRAR